MSAVGDLDGLKTPSRGELDRPIPQRFLSCGTYEPGPNRRYCSYFINSGPILRGADPPAVFCVGCNRMSPNRAAPNCNSDNIAVHLPYILNKLDVVVAPGIQLLSGIAPSAECINRRVRFSQRRPMLSARLLLLLPVCLLGLKSSPVQAQNQFASLRTINVDLRKGQAVVDMRQSRGAFSALRFRTRRGKITLVKISLFSKSGPVQTVSRRINVTPGRWTGPIALRRRGQQITRMVLNYIKGPGRRVTLEIQGRPLPARTGPAPSGTQQAGRASHRSHRQPGKRSAAPGRSGATASSRDGSPAPRSRGAP